MDDGGVKKEVAVAAARSGGGGGGSGSGGGSAAPVSRALTLAEVGAGLACVVGCVRGGDAGGAATSAQRAIVALSLPLVPGPSGGPHTGRSIMDLAQDDLQHFTQCLHKAMDEGGVKKEVAVAAALSSAGGGGGRGGGGSAVPEPRALTFDEVSAGLASIMSFFKGGDATGRKRSQKREYAEKPFAFK